MLGGGGVVAAFADEEGAAGVGNCEVRVPGGGDASAAFDEFGVRERGGEEAPPGALDAERAFFGGDAPAALRHPGDEFLESGEAGGGVERGMRLEGGDDVWVATEAETEVDACGQGQELFAGERLAGELEAGGEIDAQVHFLIFAPAEEFGVEVEGVRGVEETDAAEFAEALPVFDAPAIGLAVAVEAVAGGDVVRHEREGRGGLRARAPVGGTTV